MTKNFCQTIYKGALLWFQKLSKLLKTVWIIALSPSRASQNLLSFQRCYQDTRTKSLILLLQDQLVQQIGYFPSLLPIVLLTTRISKLSCHLWKLCTMWADKWKNRFFFLKFISTVSLIHVIVVSNFHSRILPCWWNVTYLCKTSSFIFWWSRTKIYINLCKRSHI